MTRQRIATGIDRGFGGVKYVSDLAEGDVESLIAEISEGRAKEILQNNQGDDSVIIVEQFGKYYLIGRYVAEVEPNSAERNLQRDRHTLNETILFLTGLGLATQNVKDSEVVVTTGLPTDDFDSNSVDYSSKIMNGGEPYVFVIYKGSKKFEKNIKVIAANIENQPKGTVISIIDKKLSEGMNWNDLKKRRFGINDFGYNTTDGSSYVGKDIVKGDKINFSTTAMSEIVATAKRLINGYYKSNKSEDEILKAIETCEVKIKGEMKDCTPLVKQALEASGKQLVEQISSKWAGVIDTFDEVILTGGCLANKMFAEILKNLYKEATGWDVTIPDNPRMANANGFYLISASIMQNM